MQIRKPGSWSDALSALALDGLTRTAVGGQKDARATPALARPATRLYDALPPILDREILVAALLLDLGVWPLRTNGNAAPTGSGTKPRTLPPGPYSRETVLALLRQLQDLATAPPERLDVHDPHFLDALLLLSYLEASWPADERRFEAIRSWYVQQFTCFPPYRGVLHLTERCNLTCTICFSVFSRPQEDGRAGVGKAHRLPDLSLETVSATLADLRLLGVGEIVLIGGEPFARSDLAEVVALCAAYGMEPEIVTNGMLATPERLQALYDSGLRKLCVSIDGTEAGHAAIRGPRSYRSTVRTLRDASAIGFRTRVNTVANTVNLATIIPLMRELVGHIDIHKIIYFTPFGRGEVRMWIPPDRWLAFFDELKREFGAYRGRTRIVVEQPYQERTGCACRLEEVVVRTDGEVYPCILFLTSDHSLGNVNVTRFFHVWMNPARWGRIGGIGQSNAYCPGYNHVFTGDLGCEPPQLDGLKAQGMELGCVKGVVQIAGRRAPDTGWRMRYE